LQNVIILVVFHIVFCIVFQLHPSGTVTLSRDTVPGLRPRTTSLIGREHEAVPAPPTPDPPETTPQVSNTDLR
jgi:hypothetical protein